MRLGRSFALTSQHFQTSDGVPGFMHSKDDVQCWPECRHASRRRSSGGSTHQRALSSGVGGCQTMTTLKLSGRSCGTDLPVFLTSSGIARWVAVGVNERSGIVFASRPDRGPRVTAPCSLRIPMRATTADSPLSWIEGRGASSAVRVVGSRLPN